MISTLSLTKSLIHRVSLKCIASKLIVETNPKTSKSFFFGGNGESSSICFLLWESSIEETWPPPYLIKGQIAELLIIENYSQKRL